MGGVGIVLRKSLEELFGLRDLAGRKFELGEVEFFTTGGWLSISRITPQGLEQVPASVGSDGIGQCLTLPAGERQFIKVEHGGIVKTPLDDVGGFDDRSLCRRGAGFDDGLLAGYESKLALGVAQIDCAIEQRQHRAAIFGHRQVELRSPDCA